MQFEEELKRFLPHDLPHRGQLIDKAARHLTLIHSVNDRMNLTRITNPREAAIKHICDSIAPWRHFSGATRVLDAGTGAGFPGLPLAIILPKTRFTLAESSQKKARFVEAAVESLELRNVEVLAQRAEELASTQHPQIITARAVAPMHKLLELFGKALRRGARLMLYKGADVASDLAEASAHQTRAEVLCRYELPEGLGSRTLIEVTVNSAGRALTRQSAKSNPL